MSGTFSINNKKNGKKISKPLHNVKEIVKVFANRANRVEKDILMCGNK